MVAAKPKPPKPEDIKQLKRQIRELERKKKGLVKEALEQVSQEQFDEFYAFFMAKADVSGG